MEQSSVNKLAWVDAIRGYAILLVVMVHAAQPFYGGGITGVLNSGSLGVQLFFIASSFTLFYSLEKRKSIDQKFTNVFFFIRRLFRIAPLYWIAIAFYIGYSNFYDSMWLPPKPLDPVAIFVNAVFLNGIYPPAINYIPPGSWSVGVEMLFYITVPVLFALIKSWRNALTLIVVSVLCSVVIQLLAYVVITDYTNLEWAIQRDWALYFWFPNQFPVFGLGILMFFLIRDQVVRIEYKEWMLVLVVLLFFALGLGNFSYEFPWFLIQREYLYSILFIAFAWCLSRTKITFAINSMVHVGRVSFSLYLLHPFIIEMGYGLVSNSTMPASNKWLSFLLVFVFAMTAGTLISTITYRFIERPGIVLGERIIDKIRRRNYATQRFSPGVNPKKSNHAVQ
ncbi:MAG: acyltransferase [Chryseolinea sp.]